MSIRTDFKEFLDAIPFYIKFAISGENRFVMIELSDTNAINENQFMCDEFVFNLYYQRNYLRYDTLMFGLDRVFIPSMEYAESIMNDNMVAVFKMNHTIINTDNCNVHNIINEICSKVNKYGYNYAVVYLTEGNNEEVFDGYFYVSDKC